MSHQVALQISALAAAKARSCFRYMEYLCAHAVFLLDVMRGRGGALATEMLSWRCSNLSRSAIVKEVARKWLVLDLHDAPVVAWQGHEV
jgi:hypothetical protein